MLSNVVVTVHLQQWDWQLRSQIVGRLSLQDEVYQVVDYLHEVQ